MRAHEIQLKFVVFGERFCWNDEKPKRPVIDDEWQHNATWNTHWRIIFGAVAMRSMWHTEETWRYRDDDAMQTKNKWRNWVIEAIPLLFWEWVEWKLDRENENDVGLRLAKRLCVWARARNTKLCISLDSMPCHAVSTAVLFSIFFVRVSCFAMLTVSHGLTDSRLSYVYMYVFFFLSPFQLFVYRFLCRRPLYLTYVSMI